MSKLPAFFSCIYPIHTNAAMPSSREGSPGRADGMSSHSSQVDEQLALELDEHIVRDAHERLGAELRSKCEAANQAMSLAWKTIQSEMASFRKQKTVLFSTLKRVVGHDRANRVIRMGLDSIEPSTYRAAQQPEVVPPKPSYVSPLASPRRDDALFVPQSTIPAELSGPATNLERPGPVQSPLWPPKSAKQDAPATPGPAKPASTKTTFSVSNRPHHGSLRLGCVADPEIQMKRSGDPNLGPATPSKKAKGAMQPAKGRAKPDTVDIDPWEVEGEEYIFTSPGFGPGYFILRCNHGLATKPTRFTVHPFETDEATKHFNSGRPETCHESPKQYTDEEIMTKFAHRGKLFGAASASTSHYQATS